MAIRKDDVPKIEEIIENALLGIRSDLRTLRPQGFRKTVFWLREAGILAIVIRAFVTLIGITASAIYRAVTDVSEEAKFRTHTDDRLTQIEEDIKTLRNVYSPLINAIGDPSSVKKRSPSQVAFRFREAKLMVTSAMENKIPADPRLLEISAKNLQSILHTVPLPEPVKKDGESLLVRLDSYRAVTSDILEGKAAGSLFTIDFEGGGVALGAYAILGIENPVYGNSNTMSDTVFVGSIISGFTQQNLTAIRWVDVTFKDDGLVYRGGPLYLDGTRFINCKYLFGSDSNSVKALQAIKASGENPVTLVIPGSENPTH
jgi:hypothetical protein